ncbi:NAD-dependent epimerase/dehydratase family protein [Rhodococcus sp. SJ-3]|uniref:NAD-dependent epimerase/dehydratase family protein n=1 Tax=Rhodococcus sp. SJ-3 TaxID=3454628 RepID=UPI003F7A262E
MRTLVTGAAGFIGSALVDRLLTEGHHVVGVDDLSSGTTANLERIMLRRKLGACRFVLLQRDIQCPELAGIVAGANPEVIFHLAAQVDPAVSVADPQFDARINVLGTINVCEAGRRAGVRRVVYATSGSPRYDDARPIPPVRSSSPAPTTPCEAAKLAGELYLNAYARMYGLAPICLALADVYDPREENSGRADTTEDRVCVDDAVEAFVRAGRAPMSVTGTFCIRTGETWEIPANSGSELGCTAAVGLHPESEEVRRAS